MSLYIFNVTDDERAYLNGENTRILHSVFNQMATGILTQNDFEKIRRIAAGIDSQATLSTGGWFSEKIAFIGDRMSVDSSSHFITANAVPLPNSDPEKNDHGFFLNHRKITAEEFIFTSRALPVIMRLKHVQDRAEERKTRKDFVNPTLFTTIALAVAMCKIMEEKYSTIKPPRIPIVLPAIDGLYLGELNLIQNSEYTYNRLSIHKAFSEAQPMSSKYKWFPQYKANIWTYIGEKEMRPDQKRLQSSLSGFLNTPKDKAIGLVMDDFFSTHSNNMVMPCGQEKYAQAMRSLNQILNSDLWRSTVYLPAKRNFIGMDLKR